MSRIVRLVENKRPHGEDDDCWRSKRLRTSEEGQGTSTGGHTSSQLRRIFAERRRKIDGSERGIRVAGKQLEKQDSLPLGYKALEEICKSDSPDKGILYLFNKSKRFEALLNSTTEIRPDLMKLVIRAIHMCCTPNDKRQIADKMLRMVIKTHFLPLHLTKFISKMSYASENGDNHVLVSLLAEIFMEFLQRFGRGIVDSVPHAQLNETLRDLKNKRLLHDTDELEGKVLKVKELRDEVIRRKTTSGQIDESQLTPPENFREMSVIPQAADLRTYNKPFLRVNVVNGSYENQEHYLDVQFRLLREDFVLPLRKGIKQLQEDFDARGTSSKSHSKREQDVRVYRNVTVLYPVCSEKGMVYRIRFDSSKRNVNWEKSKLFKFGSLLCLSADEFNTLLFATVENRNPRDLYIGELEVRFEGVQLEDLGRCIEDREKFDMVESPAFFSAYRPVLEGLQEIEPDGLPFEEHIVKCGQDVKPPDYENKTNGFFDLSGIIEGDVDLTELQANTAVEEMEADNNSVSSEESDAPGYRNLLDHEWDSDSEDADWVLPDPELMSEDDSDTGRDLSSVASDALSVTSSEGPSDGPSVNDRPAGVVNIYDLGLSPENLGFNTSQMSAFKMALTRKFAVIQGPPGTGKTYVGQKIAHVLLQSASLWQGEDNPSPILMVSYTNHALDDFLVGLPMEGIVRVGGRCSEKLKSCSLRTRRDEAAAKKQTPFRIYRARKNVQQELREIKEDGSLERCISVLNCSRRGILAFHILKKFMSDHQKRWFEGSEAENFDSLLCDWLGVKYVVTRKDSKNNDRNMVNDRDFQLQMSARNFSNEEDFEDNEEDEARKPSDVIISTAEDTEHTGGLRRKLLLDEVMTEREESQFDLGELWPRQRWKLLRLWIQRAEKYYLKKLQRRQPAYERALARKFEVMDEEDFHVLQTARIIGMTTTCAARYRRTLQRIRPKIVLVEEAAEVLEAHIITSLTKSCQHLILIGDHKQLRPKPEVYELAKKYNLDVSLFERMVNVGIQCQTLNVQHRMRPEIAASMKHIYDDLQNHVSVEKYEDIRGMKKNMFFVDHSQLEDPCEHTHSHVNEHEAKFIVALCRYLLQQGYDARQITLLTTYTGQMFAIRDFLREEKSEELDKVRLTTVDNFQGEENDIILLSLVRSNKDEKAGFIKIENRACVALSRAKKGFYCIGNFDLLCKHSDIWPKIVEDLKASGSFGTSLPLVCQSHKDEITAETAEDFADKAPEGGCQLPCETRLKCGHVCRLSCHPYDVDHVQYCCKEPCARKIVGCDHICPKLCCKECETVCSEIVEKSLPFCGHKRRVKCGADLKKVPCEEQCDKILPCSHRCQSHCGQPCTTKCHKLVKRTDWPCGHEVSIACSATPADCTVPCGATLECGHQCPGNCGECRMGRVHRRCKLKCGRVLVCSHVCKGWCTKSCPPCDSTCENRCVHSKCKNPCGKACVSCTEKCNWACRHFECTKLCGELCNRPRCNEPCNKIIKCGEKRHLCRGLCGEECICAVCEKNGKDPITETFLGGEDEEGALFIQLPDCKHIFAVKDLDYYMDLPNNNEDNRHVIQLKSCPRCKTAIRRSLRYGNVIKQQLLDIEKVKAKVNGNDKEIETAKKELCKRLADLKERFKVEEEKEEWKILMRRSEKMSNNLTAAVTTNQVMLMERFCAMSQKLNENLLEIKPRSKVSAESRLEGASLKEELKSLKKRAMSERVTQRELSDINLEFTRLNVQLELCLLKHDISSLNLTLDEAHGHVMRDVRDELSSGKLIQTERADELLQMLSGVRGAYLVLLPLTPEERKQIVVAMDLKQGHWFKCPNGHVYAIGNCGGAMQRSKCPDCGAVIGGEQHRLEEGNQLAPEMDGASHAAWSQQADLENYMIIDEA